MWEFLTVFVAISVIFYTFFKIRYQYWKKRNVPYIEPTVPYGSFWSSVYQFDTLSSDIAEAYQKARRNNWRYVGTYSGPQIELLIADLDLLKNVMAKDFQYFTDRGIAVDDKQPISGHLFSLGGPKWKSLRTRLTPTFTSGKMKLMFHILADCGKILEQHIEEISGQKQGVDIKNILGCFATDIIASAAFGLECNAIKDPENPFRMTGKRSVEPRAMDAIIELMFQISPRLARMVGLELIPKEVESFFYEVIQQAIEHREKNGVRRQDFLQLLLDLKRDKQEKLGDIDFTIDEIVAQSFVFFVAGFETSSTTMSFALCLLAMNQEIQNKAREEINRVLAKYNGQVSYECLKEMEYLEKIINETLRMYAPVPFVTRVCMMDYKVPNSDLIIEKGTRITIPIRGIHYDPQIYPDPEKFDPERFTPEMIQSRHQYAHIPFGEGPRICIGMRFGIMQSKVGLVSVLKNHKVSLNKKMKLPLKLEPNAFFPTVLGGISLDIDRI